MSEEKQMSTGRRTMVVNAGHCQWLYCGMVPSWNRLFWDTTKVLN